ncbi:hypothetical protein VTH82DRAFT_2554 [Thermothelomyces myriococcoides]
MASAEVQTGIVHFFRLRIAINAISASFNQRRQSRSYRGVPLPLATALELTRGSLDHISRGSRFCNSCSRTTQGTDNDLDQFTEQYPVGFFSLSTLL